MKITEEAGQARSTRKQMEHFQGTGMWADDWDLNSVCFAGLLGELNMGKGMVLQMYFVDNRKLRYWKGSLFYLCFRYSVSRRDFCHFRMSAYDLPVLFLDTCFLAHWLSFSFWDDLHCSLWALLCCFLPIFSLLPPPPPVFIELSGCKKNSFLSHQSSRAECDFSNPASYQKEVYSSGSGSDSEEDRRLPDVVLDDLANRRFHKKKRLEGVISQTTSPKSGSRFFPPTDPLATGLYKLTRSEKLLLDRNVCCAVDV